MPITRLRCAFLANNDKSAEHSICITELSHGLLVKWRFPALAFPLHCHLATGSCSASNRGRSNPWRSGLKLIYMCADPSMNVADKLAIAATW